MLDRIIDVNIVEMLKEIVNVVNELLSENKHKALRRTHSMGYRQGYAKGIEEASKELTRLIINTLVVDDVHEDKNKRC